MKYSHDSRKIFCYMCYYISAVLEENPETNYIILLNLKDMQKNELYQMIADYRKEMDIDIELGILSDHEIYIEKRLIMLMEKSVEKADIY